jgi:hypothetical protein
MDAGEEMDYRFKKLLEEGKALGEDFLKGYRRYKFAEGSSGYSRWKKDCLELVRDAFGEKSAYYLELGKAEKGYSPLAPGSVFSYFMTTLRKAGEEFRRVPAPAARPEYASDLMEDFLVRAEGMAAKGHYISAATLAGTVLEDVMRKLCKAHGVFYAENVTLEAINDKLLKAGVYDAAWHSETSQRIGLRRTAELCYTDKINSRNVLDMIGWLRIFMRGQFVPGGSRAGSAAR